MTKLLAFTFALLLATVSSAAEVSGKWFGKDPSRDTTVDTTFTFKVEGDKLTGTVEGASGARPIMDGKVTGDKISFVVERERGKSTYQGAVSGDEIRFTRTGRGGQPREFVAKRVK